MIHRDISTINTTYPLSYLLIINVSFNNYTKFSFMIQVERDPFIVIGQLFKK